MQLLRQPGQKAVTLRRIWSVINQLILLCTAVMVLPAAAAGQTPLALAPGWYGWSPDYPNSPVPPFYNGPDWSVVWQDSYVYDYPPEAGTLYWYARITYRNISNRKLLMSCRPPDNTLTPA